MAQKLMSQAFDLTGGYVGDNKKPEIVSLDSRVARVNLFQFCVDTKCDEIFELRFSALE
jgi:hypothetical protein